MLAVASFVSTGGDAEVRTEVAAGDQRVHAAAVGDPISVRRLLSETTSTLVAASGATTTTTSTTSSTVTAPESTPTSAVPATTAAPVPDPEPVATTAAPAPSTTTAPRPAPTTTAAPPTTAAPTTTAPPTTAPPTTAAPAPTSAQPDHDRTDPRGTQVWHDLAQCESGGNWSIDTGNGYYGGLQFSLGAWESVGGTGYPHEHPVATQIEMGRRLQAQQGWGAWPHCSEKLGLR